MNFNYSRFLAGSIVFGAALAIFVLSPQVHQSSPSNSGSTLAAPGMTASSINNELGGVSFGITTALASNGWPDLPPNCPPPTCWLSFGVTTAHAGDNVTLYWSSTNATSGYLQTYEDGYFPTAAGNLLLTDVQNTYTYTATFFGPSGQVDCSATLTVLPNTPPTLTISKAVTSPGNGATVHPGDTISYRITVATGGAIQNNVFITDIVPAYTHVSSQGGGTTYNSNSGAGTPGGSEISWGECANDGNPTGPCATSPGWNGTITFSVTVDANAADGTQICNTAKISSLQTSAISNTVCNTVRVNPPQAPVCTLSVNPSSIQSGQSTTLSWTSQNATAGSISGVGAVSTPSGSMTAYPPQTQTYIGTFSGPGGTVNCQATVTVTTPPQAPVCTLTTNPASIQSGQSTTLSWTSSNATSFTISGIGSVNLSGSMTAYPPQTQTYVGTVTGPGGTAQCQATVTITAAPQAPICTLTANPTSIKSGETTTLTWSSNNATGATMTGVGAVGLSGSITVAPTQTKTYTMTFTGPGGSVNCSATVTVTSAPPPPQPAPTCIINASPTIITQQGQNITLNWDSENATIGSISNIGSVNASGGSKVINPSQNTTYTGTFSGPGGSVNCNVTINVNIGSPTQPTCTLTANPASVAAGQPVILTWTSQNATAGSLDHSMGAIGPSGSQTVYPSQSTTYIATFTGSGGSVNCQAGVTINQTNTNAPTCTLTANSTYVNPGAAVTLSWTSSSANYGSITNIGSVSTNGSQTLYPTQSQSYQGTFSGPGGSVNCFVTINVNQVYVPPTAQPPYISLSQAPYTGLDLGPWGTAAYWTFLLAWCAFAAYLVGVKKVQNKLFDYVMGSAYGTSARAPKTGSSANLFTTKVEPNSVMAKINASQAQARTNGEDNFLISQIKR